VLDRNPQPIMPAMPDMPLNLPSAVDLAIQRHLTNNNLLYPQERDNAPRQIGSDGNIGEEANERSYEGPNSVDN